MSSVVRTQKALCNTIPKINVMRALRSKDHFVALAIADAKAKARTASTTATSKILTACTPVRGGPKMLAYLQSMLVYNVMPLLLLPFQLKMYHT